MAKDKRAAPPATKKPDGMEVESGPGVQSTPGDVTTDYQKMYLLCFNALTDLQLKLDECSILIENAQKQAEGLFVEMGAPDAQNAHIRIAKK